MIGSAKVTLWDGETPLPLEKLFGINCLTLPVCGDGKNIWHVGRFAISQKENTAGLLLLKRLLALVIAPICQKNNGIMIAECDSKFVKVLNLLGIQTRVLGKGINYLGSETLPIYSTSEWLKIFLDKTVHLISPNIMDLTDSSVERKFITESVNRAVEMAI